MLTQLTDTIITLASKFGMTIAVAVTDLNDGDQLHINADQIFPGASLIKVPMAVHLLKMVEDGDLSLSDTIDLDLSAPEYQQPFGSGIITNMNSHVHLTIRDLLLLSLTVSDNLATNILLKLTSFDAINTTLREFGFNDTQATTPIHNFAELRKPSSNPLTACELDRLFSKLFRRELPLSDVLLDILYYQKYASRIPLFLPEFDVNLLNPHKTGSIGGFLHDAGLVMRPEFNYTIVLLSGGSTYWHTGSLVLARISELIYIHMVRKYTDEDIAPVRLSDLDVDV